MKKYLGLLVLPLFFIALPAFANSVTPTSSATLAGITATLNANDGGSYPYVGFYLFDSSGNSLYSFGGSQTLVTNGSYALTSSNFPYISGLSLASGTYSIAPFDTGSSPFSGFDSYCGLGETLTTCETHLANSSYVNTFTITGTTPTSTATSSYYYDNTVFNDLTADFIWGLLAGILIAPFWLILDRRKKGRKNNPTL